MPKRNIDDIYNILDDMMEGADKLINLASDLVTSVSGYGGELKRVLEEQMGKYFIPAMQKLRDDKDTPGCIAAQLDFLNSIPLWQTRIDTDPTEDYKVEPENMPQPNLDMPASSSVDPTQNLPYGASYQQLQGIDNNQQASQSVNPNYHESKNNKKNRLSEAYDKWMVYRVGKPSALGEDVANIDDDVNTIGEYDSEEEAEFHCKKLNDMISPEEKDLLKTEYKVKKKTFNN